MKLSRRMKDILLILYKTENLTRNDIIVCLEEKRDEVLVKSSVSSEYILKDKIRVSYDRTFRRLKELELLEGSFPSELRRLSPYQGTLWRGYVYRLTSKGRMMAEKIRRELLESVEHYSFILHERRLS